MRKSLFSCLGDRSRSRRNRANSLRRPGMEVLEDRSLLAPLLAVTGGPYVGTIGQAILIQGSATGGTGPYTYSWDMGAYDVYGSGYTIPEYQIPYDGFTYYTEPTSSPETLTLTVTDSLGASASASTTFSELPGAPVLVAQGPWTVQAGQSSDYNVSVPGVTTDIANSYTYHWNFGDGSSTVSSTGTTSHSWTYQAAGNHSITVTATDPTTGLTSDPVIELVTVSQPPTLNPPFITTPFDKIPDFGANPTVTSVRSGNWSNAATWSTGVIPTAGAIVDITSGTTVSFDLANSPTYNTVNVRAGGELDFRTTASSTLNVGNLEILQGGTFQIGTQAAPLPASVNARVVFADQPINTTIDPSSYGTGLIDLGTVNIEGAVKSSYVTINEAHAGDQVITLTTPEIGWAVGDRIVFPDTRQLTFDQLYYKNLFEFGATTIKSISADGLKVTLSQPLNYDHLGARDPSGALRYLPQIMNMTRNVSFSSANPNGTRAHTMFTGNPNVDIRYVGFYNLGRTTDDALNSTTFNSDGSVAHLGTNQIGRYPLHIHHDLGPANPTSNGYTFSLIGNAIDEGDGSNGNEKWGITIHASNGGLIQGNVLYNITGGALVTEDGSEQNNVIDGNMIVRVTGLGGRVDNYDNSDGVAREASGMWLGGPGNIVKNNIVCDVYSPTGDAGSGNAYMLYFGRNPYEAINQFTNNTAYGATNNAMEIWNLGSAGNVVQNIGPSVIEGFTAWHIGRVGIYNYPTHNLTIDHFTFIDDLNISTSDSANAYFSGDYLADNTTITNADIEGAWIGISVSTFTNNTPTNITNSHFVNWTDIITRTQDTSGASVAGITPRHVIVDNDTFDLSFDSRAVAIERLYLGGPGAYGENLIQTDQLLVKNYNGVAGDNFEVFYDAQAPGFVIPQSVYNSTGAYPVLLGSPEVGLTNAQNWAKYGIAIAGEVAPTTATTRNGIIGLVN